MSKAYICYDCGLITTKIFSNGDNKHRCDKCSYTKYVTDNPLTHGLLIRKDSVVDFNVKA